MDTTASPLHGIILDTAGKRLRAERERLGLSQEEMAKRAGVHRRTQVNYELDRRPIPFDYLDAVDAAGVDSAFVMSGVRVADEPVFATALNRLLFGVLGELGYSHDWCETHVRFALEIEKETTNSSDGHAVAAARMKAFAKGLVQDAALISALRDSVGEIDPNLLGEILTAIDQELGQHRGRLAPEKTGRLVAAAYRAALRSGGIDTSGLTDLVQLAL